MGIILEIGKAAAGKVASDAAKKVGNAALGGAVNVINKVQDSAQKAEQKSQIRQVKKQRGSFKKYIETSEYGNHIRTYMNALSCYDFQDSNGNIVYTTGIKKKNHISLLDCKDIEKGYLVIGKPIRKGIVYREYRQRLFLYGQGRTIGTVEIQHIRNGRYLSVELGDWKMKLQHPFIDCTIENEMKIMRVDKRKINELYLSFNDPNNQLSISLLAVAIYEGTNILNIPMEDR